MREYNRIRPKSSYFFTTLKAGNKGNKVSVRYLQEWYKICVKSRNKHKSIRLILCAIHFWVLRADKRHGNA